MKGRRYIVVGILGIALVAAVATAAAFAYRWMAGTATVAPATEAQGAACTGFYSSAAEPGITLPVAGTNYDAPTYGNYTIQVTTGAPTCQWTVNNTSYTLYDSITLNLPLTVGAWYIKDVYGFGYNGTANESPVYVTLKVEEPMVNVTTAKLILYLTNGTTISYAGALDLTASNTLTLQLQPGEAIQLDLLVETAQAGTYTFKVGFYASQTAEQPR